MRGVVLGMVAAALCVIAGFAFFFLRPAGSRSPQPVSMEGHAASLAPRKPVQPAAPATPSQASRDSRSTPEPPSPYTLSEEQRARAIVDQLTRKFREIETRNTTVLFTRESTSEQPETMVGVEIAQPSSEDRAEVERAIQDVLSGEGARVQAAAQPLAEKVWASFSAAKRPYRYVQATGTPGKGYSIHAVEYDQSGTVTIDPKSGMMRVRGPNRLIQFGPHDSERYDYLFEN